MLFRLAESESKSQETVAWTGLRIVRGLHIPKQLLLEEFKRIPNPI